MDEENTEVNDSLPSPDINVLKSLSKLNGEVNAMPRPQMIERLISLKLSTRGGNEILKRRLKAFYKQQKLNGYKQKVDIELNYESFIVIDFEATCDSRKRCYRHEIIEFPAVLIDIKTRKIKSEFHSYVKPVINPKLTGFCTNLTGITQAMVNNAPVFTEVLAQFENWMSEHNLCVKRQNFAVITDGPWDMGKFLLLQCKYSNIVFPKWAKKWINIRKSFSTFYNTRKVCLLEMLKCLGLKFKGRPHCGLHDARNIAWIAIQMMEDSVILRENEKINAPSNTVPDTRQCRVYYLTVPGLKKMRNKFMDQGKPEDEEDDDDDDEAHAINMEREVEVLSMEIEGLSFDMAVEDTKEFPALC